MSTATEGDDLSRNDRLDRFMDMLNSQGEDVAIETYGDPQYWDRCRHGQWFCRYRGKAHAANSCVHEDAPRFESTAPTHQLSMFEAAR